MTAVDDRTLSGRDTRARRRRPTVLTHVRTWLGEHRASLLVLLPLLAGGALVHAVGMDRAPQRVDDEGTYVAQAYAVQYFGDLAHYTYWYDHPPLGWLQIAAWTWLTDAFERTSSAVAAGREFMLLATIVASALLWVLARRIGLSRVGSAAAVAMFMLSPLAVSYHRMAYLDNVATPWLLGAFVLAASRRNQLASFSGAAVCFVVAMLTKETFVLLLPVLAWWMWRHAAAETRRYTLTVAASLTAALGLGYVMFAALKGELLPGGDHVSLVDGITFQLFERASSGSVLDRSSQAGDTVEIWLHLDWVLPAAATVAALALVLVRRTRPLAAAYLLLLLLLLRPGYLPVPYVVAMLPFAALLVAAAVELAVRRGGAARIVAATAAVAALVAAVPVWSDGLGRLMTEDPDRSMRNAELWVLRHADRGDRLLVDDSVWVDLIRAGLPRDHVVWYYKADTDPEVVDLTPNGWRDYDYLLVTQSVRRSLELDSGLPGGGPYPVVAGAFRHSHIVKAWGKGNQQVQVRKVEHGGGDR